MSHDNPSIAHFALTAALFEGGLVPVSVAAGWLLGAPPLRTLRFDLSGLGWGIIATLPPLGLFWLCLKSRLPPLVRISRILEESLAPLFKNCRLPQLAILAVLAGVGEEMLFRGVLQAAVAAEIGGPWGMWLGLVIAAALFGLLHPITPTYAVLAGLIGFYLGGLWLVCGNLLAPIVAHGVYDFLALAYVVRIKGRGPGANDP